jgi:hypothetical protein
MAGFGLIGRFHRLALGVVIVAAIFVIWQFFQPYLIGHYFANARWMEPYLGSSQLR